MKVKVKIKHKGKKYKLVKKDLTNSFDGPCDLCVFEGKRMCNKVRDYCGNENSFFVEVTKVNDKSISST